jgi:pentapeptide MXKDX repeat protein
MKPTAFLLAACLSFALGACAHDMGNDDMMKKDEMMKKEEMMKKDKMK